VADTPERFDALQRIHDFSYVVLPVAYPDRYLALIAHLDASPDWKILFTDGTEILFGRRTTAGDDGWDLGSPATTDKVLAIDRAKFRAAPRLFDAARIHLATLDLMVGEFRESERILADAPTPEAQALRARGRLASGDLRGAEEIGDALLEADGGDTRALDVLAIVHARRGELPQATSLLRRALSLDPYDIEATSLLANLEKHHENP
jgi:tetratricopeptide (TPR) repeat protein